MIIERANQSLAAASAALGFDATKIEQGSDLWLRMKLGVISASNADAVLAGTKTAKRQTYMASLIKEVMTCQPSEQMNFKQTEHGHLWESTARESLSLALMADIKEVPFIYRDEDMRAGCSPDGVFDNTVVELKCPYDSAVFVRFAFFDEVKPEYEKQFQFQMWCTGAEQAVFGNYDDRMVLCRRLHHQTFERSDKFMKLFDDAVPQFIHDMDKILHANGVRFGAHWRHLANLGGGL